MAKHQTHSPGKPDQLLLREHLVMWMLTATTKTDGKKQSSLLLSSSQGKQEQAPCSNAIQPPLTPCGKNREGTVLPLALLVAKL